MGSDRTILFRDANVQVEQAGIDKRGAVLRKNRVPAAASAARFSALLDRTQLLPARMSERTVGEDLAASGQNIPGESREQSGAKLCDP